MSGSAGAGNATGTNFAALFFFRKNILLSLRLLPWKQSLFSAETKSREGFSAKARRNKGAIGEISEPKPNRQGNGIHTISDHAAVSSIRYVKPSATRRSGALHKYFSRDFKLSGVIMVESRGGIK